MVFRVDFKKELTTISFFSVFFILLLSVSYGQSPPLPGDWAGYVTINSSTASDGTPIKSYVDGTAAESTTVGAVESGTGYYLIHVTGQSGQNVTFKVCGVSAYPTNTTPQSWSVGPHPVGSSPYFNLSITTLVTGSLCTYSCGCSGGGHCCSGATEYTDGSGTGTCQSSTCSAATTTPTTSPGGGGGGGGGNVTTTKITTTTAVVPKTTTILPKTTTTVRLTTTTIKKPKPKPLEIYGLPTVQVIGIVVGVIAVIALVVFIFIRIQAAKTTEVKPMTS
jgi:hypothetical protein